MAKISIFELLPKKGDVPFKPCLSIYLSEHFKDSEGHILLSSQLMTDKEIDEAVDSLKAQLEKVRKSAKLKLKKVKAACK